MLKKYKKFEFESFPRSMVVNSFTSNEENDQEGLINSVVFEHISAITEDIEDDNKITENNVDLSAKYDIDHKILSVKNEINIENVQAEFFQKGFDDAKIKYEQILQNQQKKNDFSDILLKKIEGVIPNQKIDLEYIKFNTNLISSVAQKLHLILPVDFKKIISDSLLNQFRNFYKEGEFNIIIHPDKYNYSIKILKSDEIESKFQNNFTIIQDNKIGIDDCLIEWKESRLEYNASQLNFEIEEMITQLKKSTEILEEEL